MSEAAPGASYKRARNGRLGFVLMLAAVTCFTMIDTSAKWLAEAGVPPFQTVFSRYAGAFLLVLGFALPRHGLGIFRSNKPWLQVGRAAALLGATGTNFLALKYLSLNVATAIMFASPIGVALLAIPVLGERVGIHRMAAIFAGFLGVLVVVQPWGAAFQPAMLLSVGTMGCASVYYVLTKMISDADNNLTSQLWPAGLATMVLLPWVLANDWVMPTSAAGVGVLVCIGGWGAVGHVLATLSLRYADASELAPVSYIQIALAAIASFAVFGDIPTQWTLIGSAIITGAGLYIWLRERRR